jgi:ribonuclease P/MRP protein subunit POP1
LSKTENNPSSRNIKFFVLRERKKLECLKTVISSLNVKNIRQNSQNACNFPELALLFSGCTDYCLVPVTLHMCGRGSPADSAIICLPSEKDVENLSRNPRASDPVEQLHTDEYQTERKELRTEHKKLLKRLRRKRVREKRKLEELSAAKQDASEDDKHIVVAKKRKANEPPPTEDITDKHVETLHALWLPQTQTVKESCSRTVIGFITKGDFSFTESNGAGQGYVVLSGLKQLVALYERKLREGNKLAAPWVLVRNPTSLQYRFGVLNIPSAM